MRSTISIFVLVLSIWGCHDEISSLIPKPRRVSNELIQISYYEPGFSYKSHLRFEIDIQNLTAQPVDLQITGGKLITPANKSYAMLDEDEVFPYFGSGLGFIEISRKTGEIVDTNSEEYIRAHLLRSTTISPHESIRSVMMFPFPSELEGAPDAAFRGVYRITIAGYAQGENPILFPELTWNADSTRTRWAAWQKHMKK
ncbi:hypothetical protein L0337_42945 [candidate division KSB1 bacterium]|nr:hypothetical protein [candidate division KSB1 bacterium]